MEKQLVTGVLPALITPLDQKGNVKTELAAPIVEMYQKEQADGLYMLGWTGEGEHLDVPKRKQWAQAVLAAAKDKMRIFVHVGYNANLDDSVALAAHAAEHGAYAVASVGIGEKASLEENVAYFKRISAAAPNVPFYIYWVAMGKTLTGGKPIAPDALLKAMEAVPTFRGIKFTDNNFFILERFKKYRPDLNILTGADELAICSQIMGADGNIGALQAVTCYHYKVMMEALAKGDIAKARELQYRANEVSEFYGQAGIGSLPGIKAIFERVYGIRAGNASPDGPFGAQMPSEESIQALVEVFRKNILTAAYSCNE